MDDALKQPLVVAGIQPYPHWQSIGELEALVKAAREAHRRLANPSPYTSDIVHGLGEALKPFEVK